MFDRSTQEGVAFLHVIRFCQKKKIANVCSVLCNNSKQTNEDRNKFNACCFYFVFFHCGFCHISSVDATAKQMIYIYFLFCFSCVWCWNASAFHEDHHTHTHTTPNIAQNMRTLFISIVFLAAESLLLSRFQHRWQSDSFLLFF